MPLTCIYFSLWHFLSAVCLSKKLLVSLFFIYLHFLLVLVCFNKSACDLSCELTTEKLVHFVENMHTVYASCINIHLICNIKSSAIFCLYHQPLMRPQQKWHLAFLIKQICYLNPVPIFLHSRSNLSSVSFLNQPSHLYLYTSFSREYCWITSGTESSTLFPWGCCSTTNVLISTLLQSAP